MSKRSVIPGYRTHLSNGLTILAQPLPGLSSIALGLNVALGSRDETPIEAGLSHLVEHMLFQGTKRRDVREISRVITAVGGNLDAATGRESTTYYAKVPAKHLPLAMDVLADMVLHSQFSAASLKKEKRVIFEEIRMYEDAPDEWIQDLFFRSFWPRHALGRSILGNRTSLARVTPPSLRTFVQDHYHPARMILAAAGDVQPGLVRKLAEKYFADWPARPVPLTHKTSFPLPLFQPILKYRNLEQVHVCLGVPGMPYADSRRLIALAFSNILGSSTNSRLFYEIRERRALVYSIYSFLDFYRDTGVAGIYFACHPCKLSETLKIIQAELFRIATRPISLQELRDVREHMQGTLLLSLESSSAHMWNMFQQEMYLHHHPSLDSILKTIRQISQSDILQVGKDIFLNQPLALSVLGPLEPKIMSTLSSMRNDYLKA